MKLKILLLLLLLVAILLPLSSAFQTAGVSQFGYSGIGSSVVVVARQSDVYARIEITVQPLVNNTNVVICGAIQPVTSQFAKRCCHHGDRTNRRSTSSYLVTVSSTQDSTSPPSGQGFDVGPGHSISVQVLNGQNATSGLIIGGIPGIDISQYTLSGDYELSVQAARGITMSEEDVVAKVGDLMRTLDDVKIYRELAYAMIDFAAIMLVSVIAVISLAVLQNLVDIAYGFPSSVNGLGLLLFGQPIGASPWLLLVQLLLLVGGLLVGILWAGRRVRRTQVGEWKDAFNEGVPGALKLLSNIEWDSLLGTVSLARVAYLFYAVIKVTGYFLVTGFCSRLPSFSRESWPQWCQATITYRSFL